MTLWNDTLERHFGTTLWNDTLKQQFEDNIYKIRRFETAL
jgi:hypothetical protein